MTFRVGQKVCCIDASFPADFLSLGAVYTVTDILAETIFMTITGRATGTGLKLGEVPLDKFSWVNATRFRPIVSRKTSIEIFERMLNPSPDTVKIQIIADKLAEIYESTVP